MSNELLIKAWKNPELRSQYDFENEHPSGKSFEELSTQEMVAINGASDVQPDTVTTPVCAVSIAVSIEFCASAAVSAGVSAVSGIVTYNKKCLG